MAIPSAPISRGHLTDDLLERGVRTVYFKSYEDAVGEYDFLYNFHTSEKRFENDHVFAGLSVFQQKTEGQVPSFDAGANAWRKQYEHLTWALGLKITREAREDDLYDVIMKLAKDLGGAAAYTQEVQALKLFNDLTSVAYSADGSDFNLLETSHFRKDGGSWSNQLASGADLTIESLETLLTQARTGTLDQRGRIVRIKPKYLVVGPSDEWIGKRILNSIQRPFTADNDINPVKDVGLELKVMTHMTDDGRWFLTADKAKTGLNWFWRRQLSMERDTEGTGSQNVVLVGSYRESHGASHPYGVWGSS